MEAQKIEIEEKNKNLLERQAKERKIEQERLKRAEIAEAKLQ